MSSTRSAPADVHAEENNEPTLDFLKNLQSKLDEAWTATKSAVSTGRHPELEALLGHLESHQAMVAVAIGKASKGPSGGSSSGGSSAGGSQGNGNAYGKGDRAQAVVGSMRADAPYGDVAYADPGYQDDKKKRYPIDTADHVKSAWSYINQGDNAAQYSPEQLANVKGRIKAAANRLGVEISDQSRHQLWDETHSMRASALRLETAGGGRQLSGLAVPYGVFAEIRDMRGHYQERIMPGAFDEALARGKPRMFFEHGLDVRTGKTPIGSFDKVWAEADGVHVRGELFDNDLTRPLIDATRAGELADWSVHFQVQPESRDEVWSREKGWNIRTVLRAGLPEISLVNFGAYPTQMSVRSSLDEITGQPSAWSAGAVDPFGSKSGNGAGLDVLSSDPEARDRALRLAGVIK